MKIKSKRSIRRHRSEWTFLLSTVAACAGMLASCRAGRNFYVLEEIRVPALQSLQKFDAPVSGQHCFELGGETVCQQYPLRPSQKSVFRLLALSPAGNQPISLSFTKLQRAQLPRLLDTNSDCETIRETVSKIRNTEIPLSTLGLDNAAWVRQVKQESPMRIEEHVINFNTPSVQSLLADAQTNGGLPLFTVEYEAKIEGSSYRTDRGAFTFTVVSAPQSTGSDQGNAGPGGANTDTARCLANAFAGNGSATTNNAPFIRSLTPTTGSKVGGSPVSLQLNLSDSDPDEGARRRVQWYISRGELENQRAATTELTFSGSEPLTAVGIVRDLQGGLDFAWTTFTGP